MNGQAQRLGGAVALAGLLWGGSAHAEYQESPQHFAVELKFGPYVPHLDDSSFLKGDGVLAGRTPFSDHFGDPGDVRGSLPPRGLLTQVEFDYQFFHKFGVLGVGLESGYFSISAPAFVLTSTASGEHSCQVGGAVGSARTYSIPGAAPPLDTAADYYKNCVSGDSDKLNVVPIALMLVYRFDVLSKRLRIPIIPYMKAGLAYYVWWFGNSSSFTSQYTPPGGNMKVPAAGGTAGVVLHPGISIDLSAIDSHAARLSDQEIGLNRIAAFIELNAVLVDGFGGALGKQAISMSDTSFLAGLSFEF